MKNLILSSIITIAIATSVQAQVTFTHYKKDGLHIITDSVTTFVYSRNKRSGKAKKQKSIYVNRRHYTLSLVKIKRKTMQLLTDSTGATVATILLERDNLYDVVLPNGDTLLWKYRRYMPWSYTKDGKEVMKGEFPSRPKTGTFVVTENLGLFEYSEPIRIALFDRSLYLVQSRNYNALYGMAMVARILMLIH